LRGVVEFEEIRIEKIASKESNRCVYKVLAKIEVQMVFGEH